MKIRTLVSLFLMLAVVGVVTFACKKNSSEPQETPSNPVNPPTPDDPEGTVTIDMAVGGAGIAILNTHLIIDENGYFVFPSKGRSKIVDLGPVDNLGEVDTVPGPDGDWDEQAEVIEGHGYVVADSAYDPNRPVVHARMYTKHSNYNSNNQLISVTLSYQDEWNPLAEVRTFEVVYLGNRWLQFIGYAASGDDNPIIERGFTYGTTLTDGYMDYNCIGEIGTEGLFTGNVHEVQPNIKFYVRAYAKTNAGVSFGETLLFMDNNGIIKAFYSISPSERVYFSQGNVQYQPSTGTWRFALRQWDSAGADNDNISPTNEGWIDMFGWGTGHNPLFASHNSEDYHTFTDWGDNVINNSGVFAANMYRTLSKDEWEYLLNQRVTNSGLSYVNARVNGVNGVVLLPDDWSNSYYELDESNLYYAISLDEYEWIDKFEANGAVFLPGSGMRYASGALYDSDQCYYWTKTNIDTLLCAYKLVAGDYYCLASISREAREWRCNVRLVRNASN